jgi:glycerophosphoryl diester phosphodiesterase
VAESSFSQVPGSLVVAHRGASAEEPENTLAAFARAVEIGADAVEFDVRLTAEGVPSVLHDDGVDRTTDGVGAVGSLTAAEVAGLTVAGAHRVPSLEETLAALSGAIGVDIELKASAAPPRTVAETIADAVLGFDGPIVVTSFDPGLLGAWRSVTPDVPTGLLATWATPPDDALALAVAGGHAWILPFAATVSAAGSAFVDRAHEEGLRVGVWIVDDPADAVALMRLGVDAIATNDPAVVVAARGDAFG